MPLKSASHQGARELLVGSKIMPSNLVSTQYLPILRTAILHGAFGLDENLAH